MDSSKSCDPFAPDDAWDERFHGYDGADRPVASTAADPIRLFLVGKHPTLNGHAKLSSEPAPEPPAEPEPAPEPEVPAFAAGGVVEAPSTFITGETGPEHLVPGALVTGEPAAGTGEAVNAETGEVTQPGQTLPPLPESAYVQEAEPLEPAHAAQEAQDPEQPTESSAAAVEPTPATEPVEASTEDPAGAIRELLGNTEHAIEHILEETEHALTGDTAPTSASATPVADPTTDPAVTDEGDTQDAQLPS